MSPFPGQVTRMGLGGTQAIVWQNRPYYIKAFWIVMNRAYGFFGVDLS